MKKKLKATLAAPIAKAQRVNSKSSNSKNGGANQHKAKSVGMVSKKSIPTVWYGLAAAGLVLSTQLGQVSGWTYAHQSGVQNSGNSTLGTLAQPRL